MNNEQHFIKLGNNFSDLIKDKIEKKIINFEYFETLELLKSVGFGEKEAVGILFGEYDIINTSTDIILCDNYGTNKLNIYNPINDFIYNYYNHYRGVINYMYKIFYPHNGDYTLQSISISIYDTENKSTFNYMSSIFINIYDTEDKDIFIVSKYFSFPIELVFNNVGGVSVDVITFFNILYTALNNHEFEDLLNALVLFPPYSNKSLLQMDFEYYLEFRRILDKWYKVENCILFLDKYGTDKTKTRDIQNRVSGIEEALNIFSSFKSLYMEQES
jgi:hypothetical protein